jgi:hypothetical protein
MAYLNNSYPNLQGIYGLSKQAEYYDDYYYMEKDANLGAIWSGIKGMIPGLASSGVAKAAPTLTRRAISAGSGARFGLASRAGRLATNNITRAINPSGKLVPTNISNSPRFVSRSGAVRRVPDRMVQHNFNYKPVRLPERFMQPPQLLSPGQELVGGALQLGRDARYAAQRAGQFYYDNKGMVDTGANALAGYLGGPTMPVATLAGNAGSVMKGIGAAQRALLPASRVNPTWTNMGEALSGASNLASKSMGYL